MATQKTPAAKAAPKGEARNALALKIVSRPETFYRCGMAFGTEPRIVPLADLTDEQVNILYAERNLLVTEVPYSVPGESAETVAQ